MAKALPSTSTWASTTPSLSTRSLFLTISPTPRTMSARLSILRAISAHGPVEHFRNLRHHPTSPQPNAFHTIVSTKESAERLLKASPFVVSSDGKTRQGYADEMVGESEVEGEGYTVEVRHSYHSPEVAVKSSPLYGGWKSALKGGVASNPISLALSFRVPGGISKEGLCDWSRDSPREKRAWFSGEGGADESVPWRITRKNREEELRNGVQRRSGSGGMSWIPRPAPQHKNAYEAEDLMAQEAEEMQNEENEGVAILNPGSQQTVRAVDSEMQRVFRTVADRFGPDADTAERNEQEAEAERIEAEKIAALRAASMERTRKRMGLSFKRVQSSQDAITPASGPNEQAAQHSPATTQNVVHEDVRRGMQEKKARYAAWVARKTEEDESMKAKSKSVKWKMFWDEVERFRS